MLRWAGVLGGVGLVAGFLGSGWLADSNLAGLVALFFTGPAGAVLGLVIGGGLRFLGLPQRTNDRALIAASVVLAVVTLAIFIPQPRLVGHLLDAEIRSCVNPQSLKASTVAHLGALEPSYKEKRPPRNWDAEFDQAFARRPGVVLELLAPRSRGVREARAPWNSGALSGDPWETSNGAARYFIPGADCAAFPPGARNLFFAHGATGIWPPNDIAEMLNLEKVAPPTPQQAEIAGR
jgi:hypothetical protein